MITMFGAYMFNESSIDRRPFPDAEFLSRFAAGAFTKHVKLFPYQDASEASAGGFDSKLGLFTSRVKAFPDRDVSAFRRSRAISRA